MDPEEFKRRLEEFAELRQMKVPKSPAIREADEPEYIERQGHVMTIDVDDNPTIAWTIKRLKPQPRLCQDCLTVVEDRIIENKRYDTPMIHWRQQCKACSLWKNPYTGCYDVTTKRSHHCHACYHRGLPEPGKELEEKKQSLLQPHFKKPAK